MSCVLHQHNHPREPHFRLDLYSLPFSFFNEIEIVVGTSRNAFESPLVVSVCKKSPMKDQSHGGRKILVCLANDNALLSASFNVINCWQYNVSFSIGAQPCVVCLYLSLTLLYVYMEVNYFRPLTYSSMGDKKAHEGAGDGRLKIYRSWKIMTAFHSWLPQTTVSSNLVVLYTSMGSMDRDNN